RKRGVDARRELLRRARGRARISALHAPCRVPRLACAGGAPFRAPRAGRRVAPRPEPPQERSVTDFDPRPPQTEEPPGDGRPPTGTLDPYEILGVRPDATQDEIQAAYQRFARYPDLWVGTDADR